MSTADAPRPIRPVADTPSPAGPKIPDLALVAGAAAGILLGGLCLHALVGRLVLLAPADD